MRHFFHRRARRKQLKRLEKSCEALLTEVDGLDMFDRAVRENVTRSTCQRFVEHNIHRLEWRCPCGREDRAELIRRAEEPTEETA